MNMRFSRAWLQGFLAIVIFVLIGELAIAFNDYAFYRLGINRTAFLFALWLLPVAGSFIATYASRQNRLFAGLSYAIVLPLLGSSAHLLSGRLGVPVDFVGFGGVVVTFKIYLVVGILTSVVGTSLGLAVSRYNRGQTTDNTDE